MTVRAGSATLLDSIELVLHPGELCAIVGPSGAGKSTLFKVVLGVKRPAMGTVTLGEGSVGDAGPIGYVPQDDALHRSLTPRQTLDFACRLRLPEQDAAARAARIDEVVAIVGLGERLDVRIRRLSGGQRKRVSLALELLTAPGVLILDEPTSGLDPGLEARMMALFQKLAREGRVVLASTHAMASLHQCDVLVVLVAGKVAYAGPAEAAPAWFGALDLHGMFDRIAARAPLVWSRLWTQSRESRAFLTRSPPALALPAPAPTATSTPAPRGGAARAAAPTAGAARTAGPGGIRTPTPGTVSPRSAPDAAGPAAPRKPTAQEQLAAIKAAMGRGETP